MDSKELEHIQIIISSKQLRLPSNNTVFYLQDKSDMFSCTQNIVNNDIIIICEHTEDKYYVGFKPSNKNKIIMCDMTKVMLIKVIKSLTREGYLTDN